MLSNSKNLRFGPLFEPFNIPFIFLATNKYFSCIWYLAKSHMKSHTQVKL